MSKVRRVIKGRVVVGEEEQVETRDAFSSYTNTHIHSTPTRKVLWIMYTFSFINVTLCTL